MAKYASAAEKQAAYRERKALEGQRPTKAINAQGEELALVTLPDSPTAIARYFELRKQGVTVENAQREVLSSYTLK